MMDKSEKKAIRDFFNAAKNLQELKIIESDKYLGDIAESIAREFYNFKSPESGRNPDHDGTDRNGKKYQVKYHGSKTRTNLSIGNPKKYNYLVVLLGPESRLRFDQYTGEFLVYRFKSSELLKFKNKGSGSYSCGKTPFERKPDHIFNL